MLDLAHTRLGNHAKLGEEAEAAPATNGTPTPGDAASPVPLSETLDRGQGLSDAHCGSAPVDGRQSGHAPRTANASVDLVGGHTSRAAQTKHAPGGGHRSSDTRFASAPAATLNGSHSGSDNHQTDAAGGSDHKGHDPHMSVVGASLSDALLLVFADAVEDLQRTRITTSQRLGALDRDKGLGDSPESKRLAALLDTLDKAERHATRELERAMKAHPLGPWVQATQGIGLKSAARLLAAIGDPAARPNPAKLWAYCGFHVKDGKRPKRTRGQQANWNTKAKTRAYLCAESCMKNRKSPYRAVYERERAKWADRDTTDLHKHNHALSVTAKAILLDLWREARTVAS